jgi:tetratricopeptide (TPR) repeat protein
MILGSATSASEKEFVLPQRQFHLEPPEESPLVSVLPSAVTRQQGVFDVTWVENLIEPGVTSSEAILEDILVRSRRDADRFPASALVRANYGLALLNRGRLDEAAEEFLAALKLSPDNFVSVGGLAHIRTLQGRFEDAERLYESWSKDHPEGIAPLVNLAYISLRKGDFDRATRLLKDAISLDDTAVLPHFLMAVAYLKIGNTRGAINHFRAAAKSDVRSPAIHQALGVAYAVAGDAKRAVRSFKTALTLAPEMKDAVRALSIMLLQRGETESLIELLGAHLERVPEDIPARELLAEAFLRQKQYPAARAQYMAALRQLQGKNEKRHAIKRAVLFNNIGVCFDHQGDLEQAGQWFARSIEAQPVFEVVSYLNLAKLRVREGKFDQAWGLLELSREMAPGNRETPELQVLVLERQRRYPEAIEFLHAEIVSGNGTARLYADLGWLLSEAEGELAAACDVMSKGLERYPGAPELVNNLAYALLMNGEPEEARRILESMPTTAKERRLEDDVAFTATWGLLNLWEGDLEKGREYYRKAELMARDSREMNLPNLVRQKMHLEVARTYIRRGNLMEAKAEVSRGLSVRNGRDFYERDLAALRDELETLNQKE